jgi:hypothetical protein
MRLLTTIIYCLFFSLQLTAQDKFNSHDFIKGNIPSYKPSFDNSYPAWGKMLYDENPNFLEIQKKYNEWKKNPSTEFKAIERYYKIWVRNIKPYVRVNGEIVSQINTPPPATQQSISSENEWSFLGPKETFFLNESGGEMLPSSCPWQVNVYSFDVSKSNDSILYCGTETGFVNKSTDKGDSWVMLAKDYSFNAGITALAIDPQNEQTVYVAAGAQLHKTNDGGENWNTLLDSDGLFYSDKIIIDESNSDKIIAAGSNGIFYSTDGGLNWSNQWEYQSYDVHFKSNDASIVFAITTVNGDFKLIKSNNGGASFSTVSSFPSNIADESGALLAVSPDDSESIFALLLSSNDTPLLYKGNLAMDSWEVLAC